MRSATEGKVATVTITETMIEGTYKEPQGEKEFFIANCVDPAAAAVFEKAGVDEAKAELQEVVASGPVHEAASSARFTVAGPAGKPTTDRMKHGVDLGQ